MLDVERWKLDVRVCFEPRLQRAKRPAPDYPKPRQKVLAVEAAPRSFRTPQTAIPE